MAAVYNKMEETDLKRDPVHRRSTGVSETLAPAMLQFLQYKTF